MVYTSSRLTISIHSLVKRETVSNQVRLQQPEYFNPLPRKEGDVRDGVCIAFMVNISIHSLVKRETYVHKIYKL